MTDIIDPEHITHPSDSDIAPEFINATGVTAPDELLDPPSSASDIQTTGEATIPRPIALPPVPTIPESLTPTNTKIGVDPEETDEQHALPVGVQTISEPQPNRTTREVKWYLSTPAKVVALGTLLLGAIGAGVLVGRSDDGTPQATGRVAPGNNTLPPAVSSPNNSSSPDDGIDSAPPAEVTIPPATIAGETIVPVEVRPRTVLREPNSQDNAPNIVENKPVSATAGNLQKRVEQLYRNSECALNYNNAECFAAYVLDPTSPTWAKSKEITATNANYVLYHPNFGIVYDVTVSPEAERNATTTADGNTTVVEVEVNEHQGYDGDYTGPESINYHTMNRITMQKTTNTATGQPIWLTVDNQIIKNL